MGHFPWQAWLNLDDFWYLEFIVYFLVGDRHIRTLTAPSAFPHGAGYTRCSVVNNTLFNYCVHSRGEYNKGIGSLPLLQCGGRMLRGGLSMTESLRSTTQNS